MRDWWGNIRSLVPACVLAIEEALERIIGPTPDANKLGLDMATDLLSFSISLEISLRITVLGFEKSNGEIPLHDPNELRVQISAADAIKVLEALKSPEEGEAANCKLPSRSRLAGRIMQKMHVDKLGRVLGEEADKTLRLNQWPDKPHAFFHGGIQNKGVYVDKIEWATEGQELMKLQRWFRMY